jgi:hypothetical protein
MGFFLVMFYGYQLVKVWGYYWILMACILVVVVVAPLRWLAQLRALVYVVCVKLLFIITLPCLTSIIGPLRLLAILYSIHCYSINYIL